jgi:hypothetical protein
MQPGSPSDMRISTIEAVDHSAASPSSREAKRAAIQKVVDERRRMIAAERLQLNTVESPLSPSHSVTPERQSAPHQIRTISTAQVSSIHSNAPKAAWPSACAAEAPACLAEVFPEPSLSPSQQRALDHHQHRLLRARVSQGLRNEEKNMEWHASLRKIVLQLQHQEEKLGATDKLQKSPLSQNFDKVIRSVTTMTSVAPSSCTEFFDSALDRSTTQCFNSPFSTTGVPTPGGLTEESLNRTNGVSPAFKNSRSASRQLDFDSELFSFEVSPLKCLKPGRITAVGGLLQHPPFQSGVIAQQVR